MPIIRLLNLKLNDGTSVDLSRGKQPNLYISLQPVTDSNNQNLKREWLVIPLEQIDLPPNTHYLLILWLLTSVALLILAGFFGWYITRPIIRLSQAAANLAKGKPEFVKPSGPKETHNLGERFNSMLNSLQETKKVQQTLLAGLPHDLKSPLARMWLRLEMTEDATLKEGMRNDVQEMQSIINQFISYVRNADLTAYNFKIVDLKPWLEDRIASWEAANSQVYLKDVAPQNLTAKIDELAFGRMLDNLISNALKHGVTPVEVYVSLDNQQIRISIIDHSKGIPSERRKEALLAFSRLDEARTATGSVGLGLALVEIIIKAHSGRLELNQASHGGLQVDVYLPLFQ